MLLSSVQVLDELKQRELRNSEKEEKIQVKKKTIDLLPDADNNLLKLQGLVEASAKRVVNLASQWEKHRAPLVDEYRRLKDICSSKDVESSKKLSEIKSLHEKIRVSTEEAKKKEDAYKQLVTELENLPQDVSRSAYTQRILEIVSNIKKQKEEITKILSDTKELQKEINNLTGKLDRTFAVTDELVFKDAKKDETVRKSYKYLAALHENCNQLIQTIEDTGTILREIRDLEEQIETENGNKTVANLERILEDYKAIRQENASLAAKVREG
ncbi:coiled-coil domain-containing protein 22 [Oreochromis niloticus]|uniref:coiled-coil domain-containing protein 22 n=1 Tax=Oreochromis niloticus TaxID=8128 RepID=UPI0009054840|nr:coiled-coil domain-containing protein 22 [Oreochromis niloticus]